MTKAATLLVWISFVFQLNAASLKREYVTQKTENQILVDGQLNDEAWQIANWKEGFTMYYPYDNRTPSQATQFAILYDDNFMYVAIKAFDDEPEKITRRITRRDKLDGDYLGIQFDSYNDKQTAYCFSVSAAGTKQDVYISGDGDKSDDSWDPIWWAETRVVEDGWTAEMKIPFSQLRFVNSYEQTWGIQVERYIHRLEESSMWQAKKRNDPGWVHHFGEMSGIHNIQPKRTFDLYPYVVGSLSSYEKDEDNPFADGSDWKGNVGLDGKVGLTNNLTLDFTINPDFGQVEADPSTVNLSGFELFFQEKRPFFIEGSNIINFPLMIGDGDLAFENMFYSRRIGRRPHHNPDTVNNDFARIPDNTTILGAAKITGRTENGLSIGIMESFTAKERAEIRYNDTETRYETVEPATNYSVISLQKDFGGGNTLLGGMLTATNRLIDDEYLNYLHTNAYSGGINFTKYWKDKTWYVMAKGAFTYVEGSAESITETQLSSTHLFQRPDAQHLTMDSTLTTLSGYGGNVFIGKSGGNRLSFIAGLYFKNPGFELNDMGYVRHVDDLISIFWVGYRINEPFSIFKNVGINLNHWSSFDFGGTYLGQGGNINGNATFKNNFSMGGGFNLEGEQTATSHLRGGPSYRLPGSYNTWLWVESDSRKKLIASLNSTFVSGNEDYYSQVSFSAGLTYKPMKNIEIEVEPAYTNKEDKQQYVDGIEHNGGKRYVLGTINQKLLSASLRINYNITPEVSIQYWGQPFFASGAYTDFKYVSDAHNDVFTKRYHTYTSTEITRNTSDPDEIILEVDEGANGSLDYTFKNPDFNTKVFLSNLVARWEYRPGSVLFFVWSQNREHFSSDPTQSLGNNMNNLFNFKARNTFLIKLSYRIGV